MNQSLDTFWSNPDLEVLEQAQTKSQNPTNSEEATRQKRYGSNPRRSKKKSGRLTLPIGQFESPIITVALEDDLIPESKDLLMNEATLTGEEFLVEQSPGITAADAPLSQRLHMLLTATYVVSGNVEEEMDHVQEET